jgi:hypothetical protein
MIGILESVVSFLGDVASVGLQLIVSIWHLLSGVLYSLHVEAPRLEGLLVGVVLAWLLLRRDKHPVLRILSAPLKLVLDILDLAWDQVVEILCDLKDAVVGWTRSCLGVIRDSLEKGYTWVMKSLSGIKNRLLRK